MIWFCFSVGMVVSYMDETMRYSWVEDFRTGKKKRLILDGAAITDTTVSVWFNETRMDLGKIMNC